MLVYKIQFVIRKIADSVTVKYNLKTMFNIKKGKIVTLILKILTLKDINVSATV